MGTAQEGKEDLYLPRARLLPLANGKYLPLRYWAAPKKPFVEG